MYSREDLPLKKSEIPFYAKSFTIVRSILQYKCNQFLRNSAPKNEKCLKCSFCFNKSKWWPVAIMKYHKSIIKEVHSTFFMRFLWWFCSLTASTHHSLIHVWKNSSMNIVLIIWISHNYFFKGLDQFEGKWMMTEFKCFLSELFKVEQHSAQH